MDGETECSCPSGVVVLFHHYHVVSLLPRTLGYYDLMGEGKLL